MSNRGRYTFNSHFDNCPACNRRFGATSQDELLDKIDRHIAISHKNWEGEECPRSQLEQKIESVSN